MFALIDTMLIVCSFALIMRLKTLWGVVCGVIFFLCGAMGLFVYEFEKYTCTKENCANLAFFQNYGNLFVALTIALILALIVSFIVKCVKK